MEVKEAIEAMIKEAESLNAGKASLSFEYGSGWEATISVKKKAMPKK